MSDESKVGRAARDSINPEQEQEVRDWCESHGVTEDELRNAFKEVQDFIATLEMLVDCGTDANEGLTHDRADDGKVPVPTPH